MFTNSAFGAFKYSYSNARVRGMKSRLLDENDIYLALKNSTLGEYVSFLENHSYISYEEGSYINTKEGIDYPKIENILYFNFLKTSKKVINFTSGTAKEFLLEFFNSRYEIYLLKKLISLKSDENIKGIKEYKNIQNQKETEEEEEKSLSKELKNIYPKLKESKNINDFILTLESTSKYKCLKNYFNEFKEHKKFLEVSSASVSSYLQIFFLNIALDKFYFQQLTKKIKKLGKNDGEIAKKVADLEIDTTNIMTLLRILKMGEEIKRNEEYEIFMIPYSQNIPVGILEECLKCNLVEDAITKLSKTIYEPALNEHLDKYHETNSLLPIELSLKKYQLEKYRTYLRGDPFHIGTILAYLRLKELEVETLRTIAIGIKNNLPLKEIEELVLI